MVVDVVTGAILDHACPSFARHRAMYEFLPYVNEIY